MMKKIIFNGKEIANSLTIVLGHAVIYLGLEPRDPYGASSWYLLPYQKGDQKHYIEHIEAGVNRSYEDKSLLIFSGGQSRRDAGPRSEGVSYWIVADDYNWFGKGDVKDRAAIEDLSCGSSLDNLICSVCRFKECTGNTRTI